MEDSSRVDTLPTRPVTCIGGTGAQALPPVLATAACSLSPLAIAAFSLRLLADLGALVAVLGLVALVALVGQVGRLGGAGMDGARR